MRGGRGRDRPQQMEGGGQHLQTFTLTRTCIRRLPTKHLPLLESTYTPSRSSLKPEILLSSSASNGDCTSSGHIGCAALMKCAQTSGNAML